MSSQFDGKCFCLITGASSGFGRSIAELLPMHCLINAEPESKIVLMGRNVAGLQETKNIILSKLAKHQSIDVNLIASDFSLLKSVQEVVVNTLHDCGKDFKHVFLFSNAGSLADVSKALTDYDDIDEIQNHFNVNVISSTFLISKFCKHFEGSVQFVVNTSSLTAVQPMAYLSLYSAGKACIDMLLRSLAVDCPTIRTLNYSPGPMDTAMTKDIVKNCGSQDVKVLVTDLFEKGTIIKTIDSARKLMQLIQKNEFESGSHIDFYDI